MMISRLSLMAARSAAVATAAVRSAGRQRTWDGVRSRRFSAFRTAHEQRSWWWSVAASSSASAIILLPLVVVAATNAPTTSAEQEEGVKEVKFEESDELESGEDPYDTLPETDEPTNCSMCRTFRNGPCRPLFRKWEACMKDHPGKEELFMCMKYFNPFHECHSRYQMLYAIGMLETVANEEIRPTLAIFEREGGDSSKGVENDNEIPVEYVNISWDISGKNKAHPFLSIDWDGWQDFVSKTNWKPCPDADPLSCPVLTVEDDDGDQRVWWAKYWELKCKNQEDLDVVSFRMAIPRTIYMEDGGIQFLAHAFVTDQDGRVLGYIEPDMKGVANEDKSEEKKEDGKNGDVDTEETVTEEKKEGEGDVDDGQTANSSKYFERETLVAYVLPNSTVGLTVQAVYDEMNDSSDKVTRKLYTSPPLSLASVIHADGE